MISPLASVSKKAKIGKDVMIESFTTIYDDVEIGDGCKIGPNVTIYPGTRIGHHCDIFPCAVIGAVPQDLKYSGENTTVEIGNHTIIRECVTIHKGTTDRMKTVVGNHCLIMGYVHIAHDCLLGDHVILANYVGLSGHVTIDDYAIIEGKAAAQQFIHIGAHSFIAGASLIRKNIPPYIRAAREPISYAGINAVGLRRRNFLEEDVKLIEDIYRILFVQNNNITNGLQALIEEKPDCKYTQEVVDFVKNSEKGILRGLL